MARKRNRLTLEAERAKIWREAWDLLLSEQYTLEQICQELHNRGYTRRSGKPWAWIDKRNSETKYAVSQLHQTFHMAFYAGWVISSKYGIKRGDVRGHWEPIVSDEEFDRGVDILKRHDEGKSRAKRNVYLLTGLLEMKVVSGKHRRQCKMYGSTPTGRNRSYSYYVSRVRVDGIRYSLATGAVDSQIIDLLPGIQVDPDDVPFIRDIFQEQIHKLSGPNVREQLLGLQDRLERLNAEEAALARLFAQGKLSEHNYDGLYREWQTKLFDTHQEIYRLEVGTKSILDDLEQALLLLAHVGRLFGRLDAKAQRKLMQILFSRIICDMQGNIIGAELNSPFVYLTHLRRHQAEQKSRQINRTIFVLQPDGPSSTRAVNELPIDDVGEFLSMVQFGQRGWLAHLGVDLMSL